MSRRCYLDTSAYLAILLREERHLELQKLLERAQLFSSVLLVLEAKRNLVRLTREKVLSADAYTRAAARVRQDIAKMTLVDVTLSLCEDEAMPSITIPRSLDLAHLRSALWFHVHEPLSYFVTLDLNQSISARALGLTVFPE